MTAWAAATSAGTTTPRAHMPQPPTASTLSVSACVSGSPSTRGSNASTVSIGYFTFWNWITSTHSPRTSSSLIALLDQDLRVPSFTVPRRSRASSPSLHFVFILAPSHRSMYLDIILLANPSTVHRVGSGSARALTIHIGYDAHTLVDPCSSSYP
ncbi:hypothetical protein HYPSUDRAFT_205096 [Hypholoma sublateritium FD-334 SS-4]|uniref:Uncharacterized protein n=1 Tax=Hypholoma sublateritium (strain FD-334 SS-4) TaxID=945553 RepID=A0A0D2KVS2_HYPSF|nr:hypothetical protein HYPSUDRAFT_205096 [Hypholoma sublateritium FD-334 SS-4]